MRIFIIFYYFLIQLTQLACKAQSNDSTSSNDSNDNACMFAPDANVLSTSSILHSDDIASAIAKDQSECCNNCNSKKDCLGWVWDKDRGLCLYKRRVDALVLQMGFTSGVKATKTMPRGKCEIIHNADIAPNHTLYTFFGSTVGTCCAQCVQAVNCKAWVWSPERDDSEDHAINQGTCWLRNSDGPKIYNRTTAGLRAGIRLALTSIASEQRDYLSSDCAAISPTKFALVFSILISTTAYAPMPHG